MIEGQIRNILRGIGGEFELGIPPCFSAPNPVNRAGRHSIVPRNCTAIPPRIGADRHHLQGAKFSKSMALTSRGPNTHGGLPTLSRMGSVASDHIFRIVLRCPPAKVRRINAGAVIAGMECQGFAGARLSSDRKRNMGGKVHGTLMARVIDNTVPAPIFSRRPRPTISWAGDVDLCPKTGLQFITQGWQCANSHGAVPSRGGQGRALRKQRFRPAFYGSFPALSQGIPA